MENNQDQKSLFDQLRLLKDHNDRTTEYLTAIDLLLVDDNNGRVKDASLSKDIQELNRRVKDINGVIETLTNRV